MISGIKEMIVRCRERMLGGACATCDNRTYCPAGRWQQSFGRPRKGASPKSRILAFVERIASAARRARDDEKQGFRGKVEKTLTPMLSSGDIGVDRVARALGVSRQALYRRLKAEGVTFEELLDRVRRELAMRYLRRDRISVKATAYKLGFSQPAAFSRAFKRWTGISPSKFCEAPTG